MKEKFLRTFGVVKIGVQGLLFLILLPALFLVISSRTDILLGIRSLVVLTGSMTPHLPVGSVVLVQKSWPYRIGDAVAFKNSSGQTVTHRIMEKQTINRGMFYKVKGDANNAPDTELVPEDAVLGHEVFMIPYLGQAINMLRSPAGFLSFIIAPLVLYIAVEVWNIKSEIVKDTEKKMLTRLAQESIARKDFSFLQDPASRTAQVNEVRFETSVDSSGRIGLVT